MRNGKPGSSGVVGLMSAQHNPVMDHEHYAELLIGSHFSAKSNVEVEPGSFRLLNDYLTQQNRELLPYLAKVISVEAPSPLKVYPGREEARELHNISRSKYPDAEPHHGIIIALTPFKLLLGFRPFPEILEAIDGIPELGNLVGIELKTRLREQIKHDCAISEQTKTIKQCFFKLLNPTKESQRIVLKNFQTRLERLKKHTHTPTYQSKLYRLNIIIPLLMTITSDLSPFMIYFLNDIALKPGEALLVRSGEPISFVDGNAIEISSNNDSPIFAGFSSHEKDIEALNSSIDIQGVGFDERLFPYYEIGNIGLMFEYRPVNCMFTIKRIEIPTGEIQLKIGGIPVYSILIVTSGNVEIKRNKLSVMASQGHIFLIQPHIRYNLCSGPVAATIFHVNKTFSELQKLLY
ncbi:hypothetical protein SNEBB_002095 [Seison nebaliae]|nr:hypothetical protein SNEBB_002095 [Seison nebaliae]